MSTVREAQRRRDQTVMDCSRLISPLRKPIYVLTRSAYKWDKPSVDKWLRELRSACILVAANITHNLGDEPRDYRL